VFKSASARRLPVLEDKELAGIISVDDLLLTLLAEFGAVLSPVAQELVHPA
jgi:CBS domain-containing protein